MEWASRIILGKSETTLAAIMRCSVKYFWRILNLGLVACCIWGGYVLVGFDAQQHPIEDWLACPFLFVLASLFAFISVWYAIAFSKCNTLTRPSWNRLSINWRNDPLQCLAISTCNMVAFSFGGMMRLPSQTRPQFLDVAMFCSGMLGFLVGQALVYRIYRHRIVPPALGM